MTTKIDKFINSLDPKTKKRLKEKLKHLKSTSGQMSGIKKLQSTENLYRLRLGKIRIIYKFLSGEIEIIDIDYRGNIY